MHVCRDCRVLFLTLFIAACDWWGAVAMQLHVLTVC